MPILAAGSPESQRHCRSATNSKGFTLLELLVVVAIIAIASAGVVLSLRDNTASLLERDAQRLAAMLESGRAQSRMLGTPVVWHAMPGGFAMEGLSPPLPSQSWLSEDTLVSAVLNPAALGPNDDATLTLGPDPVLTPQGVVLSSRSQPTVRLQLGSDGLRPFAVVPRPTASAAQVP